MRTTSGLVVLWLVARHSLGELPPELEMSTEEGQLFRPNQEMPNWLTPGRTRLTDKEYTKLSYELQVLNKYNRPQDQQQIETLKNLLITEDHLRKEEATLKEIAERVLPREAEKDLKTDKDINSVESDQKLKNYKSSSEIRKERYRRDDTAEMANKEDTGDKMGVDGRDEEHVEAGWWNSMKEDMDKMVVCKGDNNNADQSNEGIGISSSSVEKDEVNEGLGGCKDTSPEAELRKKIDGVVGENVDQKTRWLNTDETPREAMQNVKAFIDWKAQHEHVLTDAARDNVTVKV